MTPAAQRTTDDLEFPPGWDQGEDGKRIETRVRTKDFMAAVGLIGKIAEIAEAENHHPDLYLTGYNRLKIATYSHDVGELTDRDARLAKRIETLLRDQEIKRE